MKFATKIILILFAFSAYLSADDGTRQIFKHVEMNINHDNYVLFEDNSLIICDRYTDEYLAEISEDYELFIKGRKVKINDKQQKLLEEYYTAQYNLFDSRNLIGAKGVQIGIQSAGLALKAVGGAFVLIANGFDEQAGEKFEDEMEYESEKIGEVAEELEKEAEEFEHKIYIVNKVEREIRKEIDELDEIDLWVDEDCLSLSVD